MSVVVVREDERNTSAGSEAGPEPTRYSRGAPRFGLYPTHRAASGCDATRAAILAEERA